MAARSVYSAANSPLDSSYRIFQAEYFEQLVDCTVSSPLSTPNATPILTACPPFVHTGESTECLAAGRRNPVRSSAHAAESRQFGTSNRTIERLCRIGEQ